MARRCFNKAAGITFKLRTAFSVEFGVVEGFGVVEWEEEVRVLDLVQRSEEGIFKILRLLQTMI